ncbi:MAG TPA: ROK family protein [Candidatus Omnitrophota bacterium]|nr:ROK family protein [Candidatus Omnitrophota bacterium]
MVRKSRKYLLGIDIGGTKILTAVLDKQFRVHGERKVSVNADKGERVFFKSLIGSIRKVLAESRTSLSNVLAMGVGCPGIIEVPEGVVKMASNLPFLKSCPLQDKLRKRFGIPVVVENDVNVGLYGEHQLGAARGFKHVFGLFLGTGVGGAFILDGKLYHGATGAAGEIGRTFLSVPSFLSGTRKTCTVDAFLGRFAISTEAVYLILKQKATHLFHAVGYDVKKIKSNTLARAIRAGDTVLENLILNKAKLLGITMANVADLLNPDAIILGGGLIEAMGDLIIPEARKTMRRYGLGPVVKSVKVLPAKLKDHSIVKGAAKLAYDAFAR